jgi:hypothetical protein
MRKLEKSQRLTAGARALQHNPLSGTANSADPIFAAIEVHRRAENEFSAAVERLSELENELPKERRRSDVNMGVLAIVSGDDPRWVEAQKTVVTTCKTTDEAATQLLNTRPTTLAGVVAVLRYAYDYERRGSEFPGGYDDGDLGQCPGAVEWSVYFHRNLAQAIETIMVAGRPSPSAERPLNPKTSHIPIKDDPA